MKNISVYTTRQCLHFQFTFFHNPNRSFICDSRVCNVIILSIDPFGKIDRLNFFSSVLSSHFSLVCSKKLWTERTEKNVQKLKPYVMADCSTPTEAFAVWFACVYPCAVSFVSFTRKEDEKNTQFNNEQITLVIHT